MPAAAYIQLSDLKSWLGITDGDEDALLLAAILSASASIEDFCQHDLISAQRTEVVYGNGTAYLYPRNAAQDTPITAVASVTMEDGTALAFKAERTRIRLTERTAPDQAPITVVYTAGHTQSAMPEAVKLATKMTAQAIYDSPAHDQNVMAENLGGFAATFQPGGAGFIPTAAQNLLRPYIRVVMG